jgi:hypothetical protein
MSSGREQVEVARWYTPALRIPKLIGKLPSGERIWGGPYRPVQLGTAVLTAALGVKTMGVWGHFHPLANYAVVIGAAYALGWLARYIPHGSTNPLAYISGSARVASRPTHGTWGRYAVTSAEPVRVRSQLAVHALPGAPETAACSRPVITAEPDPTPVPPQPASPAAVEDKLAALLAR